MKLLTRVLATVLVLFTSITQADNLKIEDGYKQINGVNHYYKTMGQGEPIVVLHGGPGMFHDYLLPHFEPLAQDFQLIFYDQRGNGNSMTELSAETFTIDQLVEDLEGIRKAFGLQKMTVLGHSWGGLLAMYYGIKYPDNLKSLILSNPAAANSEYNMKMVVEKNNRYTPQNIAKIEQIMQSKAFQQGDVEAFTQLVPLIEQVNAFDASKMDFILKGMTYTKQRVINVMAISQLKNSFFENYDIHAQLKKITAKTLVIHGDADAIPLASAQAITKSLPNATLVRFGKSGHYPYAEQPGPYFAKIKAFIAK